MAKLGDDAKLASEIVHNPIPKWYMFQPEDGSTSVTIGTTTQEKSFRLSAQNSICLARSILEFDVLVPAQGATLASHMFMDFLPFDRISVVTASGLVLADVSNSYIFEKVAVPAYTPFGDYMTREPAVGGATVAASFGTATGCQSHGSLKGIAIAAQSPHDHYTKNDGTISAATDISGGNIKDNVGRQRLLESVVDTAVGWRVKVLLEDVLPGSILSKNDFFYLPEAIQLKFQFLPRDRWGSISTSLTNPGDAGAATMAFDITVSNLRLLICKDVNPKTFNRVRNLVMSDSGVTVQVPYIQASFRTTDASTQYTIVHQLGYTFAEKLFRLFTVFTHNIVNDRYTANTDNVNGAKITSYQHLVKGQPIENTAISVLENSTYGAEYWDWVSQFLRGSAIVDRRAHEIDFSVLHNFTSTSESYKWKKTDHEEDSGYPLLESGDVTLQVNKAAAVLHVNQFAIYLRKIRISAAGFSWVSIT